jgi:hypothetical protein
MPADITQPAINMPRIVGVRDWAQRVFIAMHDPAFRTYVARRNGELGAALRVQQRRFFLARLHNLGFSLESLRVRFLITVFNTPDYFTALLLIFYRRHRSGSPR